MQRAIKQEIPYFYDKKMRSSVLLTRGYNKSRANLTWRKINARSMAGKGARMIDAIVGRYRVRMEKTGLVLTHPSGICFDLTAEEAIGLLEFVKVYRKSLLAAERDTEPEIERVIIQEPKQESRKTDTD